jgi:hypothetical protein
MKELYKNPSCYWRKIDGHDYRVAVVFYEEMAGHEAFEIVGDNADAIAKFIIENQENIK